MTHLLLLIPLSVGMGLVGLAAFFWALRSGQFEDPDGSAWRIITPETPPWKEGTPHDHMASHPEDRDPARGFRVAHQDDPAASSGSRPAAPGPSIT